MNPSAKCRDETCLLSTVADILLAIFFLVLVMSKMIFCSIMYMYHVFHMESCKTYQGMSYVCLTANCKHKIWVLHHVLGQTL